MHIKLFSPLAQKLADLVQRKLIKTLTNRIVTLVLYEKQIHRTLGRLCYTYPSENQPLAILQIFFNIYHKNILLFRKIIIFAPYLPSSQETSQIVDDPLRGIPGAGLAQ